MGLLTFLRILVFILVDILFILPFSIIGILYFFFGRHESINNNKIVILIHGSSVSDWQWVVAKWYLYMNNISFMSIKYDYTQKITKSAQNIVEKINPLIKNDIILIGHSQGGLIARFIHDKINAKMTFLLNTPQKGASIINWLYSEYNSPHYKNDMRIGSDFIRNLPCSNSSHIYEIYGINDFVRPYESIFFGKNIYESWFGHYFSAVNPFLWNFYIIPKILDN